MHIYACIFYINAETYLYYIMYLSSHLDTLKDAKEKSQGILKQPKTSQDIMRDLTTSWDISRHLENSWDSQRHLRESWDTFKTFENILKRFRTSCDALRHHKTSQGILKHLETLELPKAFFVTWSALERLQTAKGIACNSVRVPSILKHFATF